MLHRDAQYVIALVCAVNLTESLFSYWEYSDYNTYGVRSIGLSMMALVFNVIKSSMSRVLALVVSLGYGVVRPTLGGDARKIQALGVLYLFCSLWYNFVEFIRTEQVVSNEVQLLVILPITTLDAIFYWWIFYALHRTMNQLKIRRQTAKLSMYKNFAITLISAVVSSVVMVLYQTFVLAITTEDERWDQVCNGAYDVMCQAWGVNAFWQALFLAILLCIMYIWRPSKNSRR